MATQKKISALTVLATQPAASSIFPLVQGGVTYSITRALLLGITGTPQQMFNVLDYGALGDGTTDDSTAIQSAITAAIAAGGGTVLFPSGKTYKIATTLSINPITLTMGLRLTGYGAKLSYTGSSDAIVILTNVAAADVQHSERFVTIEGFKITGTGSASSAIHNKATNVYIRDMYIENFTAITSQKAAIIMDATFDYWVEECHFQNIDIYNTGNGICFISQNDSAGASASAANNQFTNIHIWLTQAGGAGIYGVGLGASTLVQVARSVFSNIIVHFVNVANLIAFDLRKCYVEGTVFLAPGVDVSGTAATSTGWNYTFNNGLSILGPTFFPLASVTTKFTGGGQYIITGGNVPSTFSLDSLGNMVVPSINLSGNLLDLNGKAYFTFASTASAVNNFRITNAATANYPTFSATGTDSNIGMYIYPKGTGNVILADQNVLPILQTASGVASAVNYLQVANNSTGNPPSITGTGSDGTVGLNLITKSTGEIQFNGTPVSGAWQTWTPSYTNITAGNGATNYAVYKQVGKTVFFRLKFTLGTTSSVSGSMTFSLPVAAAASYADTNEALDAVVVMAQVGTNIFGGYLAWQSSTTAALKAWNAGSTYLLSNTTSSTVPFTWGSTHYFQVHGSYEAA